MPPLAPVMTMVFMPGSLRRVGRVQPGSLMNHLFGMLPEDLAAQLREHGVNVRDSEARRVLEHAITHGRDGFPAKSPVPRAVEEAVNKLTTRVRHRALRRETITPVGDRM